MGVKKPETDEEKLMLEQSQQEQQPSVEEQAELTRAQAELTNAEGNVLEQQNRAADRDVVIAKAQAENKGKERKQMSDDQFNYVKSEQAQQKLNNDAKDKSVGRAIEIEKLELEAGRDLNAELQNNMLVFDPAIGDFS